MTDADAAHAAAILRAHWQAGTRVAALPDAVRPRSRAEGNAIQAHLLGSPAEALYGWKIAATSLAGQRHIGVDGPLAGGLTADRVQPEGAVISLGGNHMRLAEAEFAFRMGRTLPPRAAPYAVAEVMAAVDTLHPAIEMPDSRFLDVATAGAAQLIADLACGRDFVLGQAAPDGWRGLDLAAHAVTVSVSDGAPQPGGGSNVLGDPRIALTWLVNELSGLGVALHAGQVVTTGTCVAPLPVRPGNVVAADFGALGSIRVPFGD